MVVHQAVGMAEPAVAGNHMGEGVKKQFPVGIAEKDLLAGVTPGRNMVYRAGEF